MKASLLQVAETVRREGVKYGITRTIGETTVCLGDAKAAVLDNLVANDLVQAAESCERLPCWDTLNAARQEALLEVCFVLGFRVLSKFGLFLKQMNESHYLEAAVLLRQELWATSFGMHRANRVCTHESTLETSPYMAKNLVVISDTHFGCRLGLCPPVQVPLDDGGFYVASDFQRKMWNYWEEFWGEWVPQATHGEPYDVVHNGDVIDGSHHNSTTQISQNINDQQNLAVNTLLPIANDCRASGGQYFSVRGTAAHVGQSSIFEEQVAQRLGAIPNTDGQYSRYDLWKKVGDALVHLLHHVGTTSSAAHEASAVNAELTAEFVEAARWGQRPPDFVVRSHRHRSIAVDLNSNRGYTAAIVTPGWQGKTPFAWKVAGARISEPQFGGIIIRQGDEEFYYRRRVWSLARTATEE